MGAHSTSCWAHIALPAVLEHVLALKGHAARPADDLLGRVGLAGGSLLVELLSPQVVCFRLPLSATTCKKAPPSAFSLQRAGPLVGLFFEGPPKKIDGPPRTSAESQAHPPPTGRLGGFLKKAPRVCALPFRSSFFRFSPPPPPPPPAKPKPKPQTPAKTQPSKPQKKARGGSETKKGVRFIFSIFFLKWCF
jgi:hypothetical protein